MVCHSRSCAKSTKAAGGGFGGFCASWRQFTCSRCHVHHTFACAWVMFNVSLTTVLLIGQKRTQARSRDQVTRGGSSSRALRVAGFCRSANWGFRFAFTLLFRSLSLC